MDLDARKQQTDFVFCFLCLEASGEWQCLWSAGVFSQFIWLGTFVWDPHYNPEIKYTSKQLKLNKIKCATHHRRCMAIEHIYICLLISCPTTHFPLFFYLNVLSYLYWAALRVSLFSLCQFKASAILMCWARPFIATNMRRQIKAHFPWANGSVFMINIHQNKKKIWSQTSVITFWQLFCTKSLNCNVRNCSSPLVDILITNLTRISYYMYFSWCKKKLEIRISADFFKG